MKEKKISIERALENVGSLVERTNSKTDWKYIKRPDGQIERIARILEGQPYLHKFLLAGQDGCGKTTELNRLEESMSDLYTVVRCDHRHFRDMNETEDIELLIVLLRAFISAAERMPEELQTVISKAVKKIFGHTEHTGQVSIEAGISAPLILKSLAKLFPEYKVAPIRKEVSSRNEPRVYRSELISSIHKTIEVIQDYKKKPVLLIVDDLEKFQYEKVYQLLTDNYQILSSFHCAVIYLVPLWILFSDKLQVFKEVFQIVNLANVPLSDRRDAPVEIGYRFFEGIATIRLGKLWTDMNEGMRKAIVFASGGNIRQFFSILRSLLLDAADSPSMKIEAGHVKQSFMHIVSGFRRILNREDREILEGVRATREFNYSLPSRLLSNFAVLEYWYPDAGTWYDVSPLILPDHPQNPLKMFSNEKDLPNA
jgi:hypothetical protein